MSPKRATTLVKKRPAASLVKKLVKKRPAASKAEVRRSYPKGGGPHKDLEQGKAAFAEARAAAVRSVSPSICYLSFSRFQSFTVWWRTHGPSWDISGQLRPSWGHFWGILVPSWDHLGASWVILGPS